ncbi:FtsX-like permease family protein [Chitinophaga sp. SYP-B3965]|uniref:ABC transporter permease n=1 Tax=Chitinophaga sp. SYP-B3965 TaxID=2663120 RepID=UPI0012999E1F|nr:ABC transporter permease [Chitinophaga sp. SYP-B3965]MRG44670.1 FtsX-like permease family protein [Chitinophaga sp. SYP-B3965]
MFKNYFLISWRNIIKDKISSTINIGGLAVGLAITIVLLLWIRDTLTFDKFHTHLPQLHQVMYNHQIGGDIGTSRSVAAPLAPILRDEVPDIKYAARTSYPDQQIIHAGENSFYERGMYADPAFFQMLSFDAIEGNPITALQDPGSVVITERTAKKLFGTANALGKILKHNNIRDLKVGAVIRDVPVKSTFKFDVVLPFKIFEQENSEWITRWDHLSIQTWIELMPSSDITVVNNKIQETVKRHAEVDKTTFFAYPLADLHLYGSFRNGKVSGGLIDGVKVMCIIGLFILLIACVNFMNLATAHSERRAREVGVRKALGASRKVLILQFLAEALSMTFLALLLALLLARLILPVVNSWPDVNISFDVFNWPILGTLTGLTILTGLVAGSYPAFFLSSFKPVRVLKGVVTNSKGGALLRKGLVTFQFVISIFLIISIIVIFQQQQHVQNRPLGYDKENLIIIPARGNMVDKFPLFRSEVQQIPGVQSITGGSNNMIRFGGSTDDIKWPGKTDDQNFPMTVTSVAYNWTKTAGLKMAAGRDFDPAYSTDTTACLLNQTAVRKMGLKEPVIGTRLGDKTVIGVVEDFVFNNPNSHPNPMIIFLGTGGMNYFFVRLTNDENWRKTVSLVESAAKRSNPEYPFELKFMKEEYDQEYRGLRAAVQLTFGVGMLAILISCLGLFGLSAFLAERRRKEIGIRKVFGASIGRIWYSLSKDFVKPVLLAFVLASPLAGFAMQQLLADADYHVELSWWMFTLSGLLAISIAVITVSFQGVKAALTNPIKSLRIE